MTTLIFDIETDGFLKDFTDVWCVVVKDVETRIRTSYYGSPAHIRSAIEHLATADRLIGHNIVNFDVPALNLWASRRKLHAPKLDWRKSFDTLVVSRLHNPERRGHSLESWGVELGFPKQPHADFSKFSFEMLARCENDVELNDLIYQRLEPAVRDWGLSIWLEHCVAHIVGLQMQNGFPLDVTRARELLAILTQRQHDLQTKLVAVFPPRLVPHKEFTPKKDDKKRGYVKDAPCTQLKWEEFNPGSRIQAADRLEKKYGWKPEKFTDGGATEISEAVLSELEYPEATLLLEYLVLEKKISQLNSEPKKDGSGGGWLHHEKNGRVHGYVNTNGAVTGRMTHSKPNMSQSDKDPQWYFELASILGVEAKALTKAQKLAGYRNEIPGLRPMMRALWGPGPGRVLVGCDAEGIELRGLGHYLARWDDGTYARMVDEGKKDDKTDVHSVWMKRLQMYDRDQTKRVEYGWLYGAGDAKLGSLIIEDAIAAKQYTPEGTPWLFETKTNKKGVEKIVPLSRTAIGATVRLAIQNVPGIGELIAQLNYAYKSRGWLKGLDGRRVRVRSIHSILNTLLQGFGGIVMKMALVLYHDAVTGEIGLLPGPSLGWIHGREFAYCVNSHDEVQQEVLPEYADTAGSTFAWAIAEAGRRLNIRCPLKGAYAIGNNWAETH